MSFHTALFGTITAMLSLFAFAAARADQLVVALVAAVLALWFASNAYGAWSRSRRKRGQQAASSTRGEAGRQV
jgi:hypothetical protein